MKELKLSFISFISAIVINYSLPLQFSKIVNFELTFSHYSQLQNVPIPILSKFCEIFSLLFLSSSSKLTCVTAYCLGFVFLIGLQNVHNNFGIYLMVLSFFHWSEFMTTGLSNSQNLSWDSFLVNHSVQYWVAMVVSWCEHAAWCLFWPEMQVNLYQISYLGCAICLTGEIIRKTAMIHAGRNFNHLVQSTKSETHELVTSGIYAWSRHPSYVGWFLWSVGTQVTLLNPVCFVLYGLVSFAFFKERIYIEEYTLVSFFGDQYRDYQRKVGTGIPGIQGFDGPAVWGESKSD